MLDGIQIYTGDTLTDCNRLRDIANTPGLLSIDVETTIAAAYQREVCTIQITHENGDEAMAYVYPDGAKWLQYIFHKPAASYRTLAFNATFEAECLVKAGLPIFPECAMIAAKVLRGSMEGDKVHRAGWSLKDLMSREFGKERDKTIRDRDWRIPPDAEAVHYGMEDTRDALQLWRLWLPMFEADPQQWQGYRLVMDAMPACAETNLHGLPFAPDAHANLITVLSQQMDEQVFMLDLLSWGMIENHNSAKQVGAWMRKIMLSGRPQAQIDSPSVFSMLYQRATGQHWPMTATGDMSLDRAAVETRMEGLSKVSPDVALYLSQRLQYTKISKLKQAFGPTLRQYIGDDGYLRGSFRLHGAQTSRMSCCLTGEALVTTLRGPMRIDSVRAGDKVWTNKRRWRSVAAAGSRGLRPVWKLTLSNGEVLTSTDTHRMFNLNGTWTSVRDILDERLSIVAQEARKCGSSVGGIQGAGCSDHQGHSEAPWYNGAHHTGSHPYQHARAGTQDAGSAAVLEYQAGGIEPHVWEDAGVAPQLAGGVFGRQWVSDHNTQREEAIDAPDCDGRCTRVGGTSSYLPCAPHRLGQDEQRLGQPSLGNSARTQSSAYVGFEGSQRQLDGIYKHGQDSGQTVGGEPYAAVYVVSCEYDGVQEVFDLTVEEDESYECSGVFHHNSTPNLQQMPAEAEFRALFKAIPGRKLIVADYSQIELRVIAIIANELNMLRIFADKADIHQRSADGIKRLLTHNPDAVATKQERKDSKPVSFGITYGAMAPAVAASSGLPLAEAEVLLNAWLEVYPGIRTYRDTAFPQAQAAGGVRLVSGQFIKIAADTRAPQAVNTPIQGSAASVLYRAMKLVHDAVLDARAHGYDIWFSATIHDELILDCSEEDAPIGQSLLQAGMRKALLDLYPNAADMGMRESADAEIVESWADK